MCAGCPSPACLACETGATSEAANALHTCQDGTEVHFKVKKNTKFSKASGR